MKHVRSLDSLQGLLSLFVADPRGQLLALGTLRLFGSIPGFTGPILNRPVWSLVSEIQLYVFAGLLAAAVTSRETGRALAIVLLCAYIAAFGVISLNLR